MSRIYDSSAITQRRRDQAQAGSFINRIQNPNNPQTSYGPLQGNYDASIMNSVKMGQPKEFYRNSGCIIISNGCPCPPIAVDEIVSGPTPPVILAPGSVSNITVEYGSVIVRWNAPMTGGTVASYTLFADDLTNAANSVTITGITDVSYIFPTYTGPAVDQLTAGDEYLFSVTAVNSAGSGAAEVSSSFYAPYVAPESTSNPSPADPNIIFINVTPYAAFTPSKYILKTYTNGTLTSTSIQTAYSTSTNSITINSGLSCLNVYAFQLQLLNDSNQYSSFTAQSSPPTPVYPAGPDIPNLDGVTNITSITAQVNYTNYTTTNGFDLTTGDAECIINLSGISYTQLTNTSVTLIGLTPLTTYDTLTIEFRKTINANIITSTSSSVQSFKTIGKAPINVSALAPEGGTVTSSGNNATIVFDPYSSGTSGEFNFDNTSIVSIPGASPFIEPIVSTSEIYIGSLSFATTYTGCRLILKNTGGDISDPSNTFTIVTKSSAPTGVSQTSSTLNTVTCNLVSYSDFDPPITQIIAYDTSSGTPPYTTTYSVSIVSQTEFIISGLTDSTSYTVGITVFNGTYISMISASFSISTQSPPPPPPDAPASVTLGTSSYFTQPITYGTYAISLTGAIISGGYGYSNLSQSGLTITGLSPGTGPPSYSGLTVQVQNAGGTSSASSIPDFTTLSLPAPEETFVVGDYDSVGNTTTITVIFTSYPAYPEFTPISGTLQAPGLGQLGSFLYVSATSLVMTGLGPGYYYTDCYITLTDGSYTTPNSNTFTVPTTPIIGAQQQPSPSSDPITITYGDVTSFNFSVSSAVLYVPGQSPITSNNPGNSSSQFQTGLTPTTYSGCYIILYNSSSHSTLPSSTFSIEIQSPQPPSYPAPDVNALGILTGTDYVTIPYSQYNTFYPSGGTLYANGTSYSYVSSISDTQMTISGLSSGQYDNCYITLTYNSNTSEPSYPTYPYFSFTIQSSPPPTYPAPEVNAPGIYTGTDYVRIPYSQYTAFYPSGGTLYTNNGSFSSFSSITDYHIEINGLSSGTQYDNCYITLTHNSNTSDPSYPTYQYFSFTTQNPSPSYPAPNVYTPAISTGTDYVTIPYSQYTAFYPSGGTLYVNGAQTGSVSSIYDTYMTVSVLASGTLSDNCYITLTHNSNTSDPSSYFSFTTVPNAPAAVQLQSYAYYTQDIIFDSYTAPLTGAIISDSSSGSYGYTNLTQSSLTITGLTSGSSYSLLVQVINAGGTSNSSSISYFTTNYPPPNPNVTAIVGNFDSNTGTATISVIFDSYLSEFIPISGTLYDSSSMSLGSYSSVSSTSLVVTGVSTNNYYTNCYITLYNGTATTPQSNTFNVGTTPVTGASQDTSYTNPIRILYNTVGGFNPFNASTGIIYVPNYGNWSGTAVSQIFAEFTLPISGTYDNCYIVLFDTQGQPTLSSNIFTITVT